MRKPLPTDRALRLRAEEKEERALASLLASQLVKTGQDADDKMSTKVLAHILLLPSVAKSMQDFGIDLDHLEDQLWPHRLCLIGGSEASDLDHYYHCYYYYYDVYYQEYYSD